MRALISGTPTANAGTPSRESGNDKGFWLQGTSGSSGSYNATVTVTLSNVPARFSWCAYASDYPPNAVETGGVYALRGTPPFIITTASGTAAVNIKSYSGAAITALADATGCPGILCGRNGEAPGLLNCCATGTTNCGGTCRAIGTYTQNNGACAGCRIAYVRQFDQCGALITDTYATYANSTCTGACCTTTTVHSDYDCPDACLLTLLGAIGEPPYYSYSCKCCR
jgi:hypothetical protein